MKVLGIIPARGGSKGIKNKNLQLINGKPLVLHAADIAIKCGLLDRIVLSTNDDAIIETVKSRPQVDISYKRPEFLATDTALIADAIAHLLQTLRERENYVPDAFMLLEPTCPLRTLSDVQEALRVYEKADLPCLVSVSEPQQHPSNMIYRKDDKLQYCMERKEGSRGRQDFQETWFINGAVYITQTEFFLQTNQVYDLARCALYIMPGERAFDINTPFDLALVRAHVHSMLEEESYA